ncbi:helix-turn-helix domain-containing protein [Bacillus paralicheniformis]|uniref:helix-turn-helix domain-containing protein n=1 Tax=Bacillus paralicheniformis TaxID=1648923 RepID=UPI00189E4FCB
MRVQLKLAQVLLDRKMSQKELCELTGIRPATLSVIIRNNTDKINYRHLGIIMTQLEITDFNEIMELIDE